MNVSPEHIRELVNKSGIPFQLAVEQHVRSIGRKHDLRSIKREVPSEGLFIDLVARRKNVLFVFECKKVEEQAWIFVQSSEHSDSETRCRLEWFNQRAPAARMNPPESSRMFCGDWNLVEPSPESDFCLLSKDKTPIRSVEVVCRELLQSARTLLEDDRLGHEHELEVVVPIIITNASLKVCRLDPASVDFTTGRTIDAKSEVTATDWVRFRKTLVNYPSNTFSDDAVALDDWTNDRERTVFICNPTALDRLFSGFRSFTFLGGKEPPEFVRPPKSDLTW